MLEANKNDPDVVASIASLLNNIAMDDAGSAKIKEVRDPVPLLNDVLKLHHGKVKVCEPVLGLIASLAKPGVGETSNVLTVSILYHKLAHCISSYNINQTAVFTPFSVCSSFT